MGEIIVRQLDGTLAALPDWMLQPQAADIVVRDAPRFSLAALLSLRAAVDLAIALPAPPAGRAERVNDYETPGLII